MPVKTLQAFTEGQPWPPPSEKQRLERYAQNRILWHPDEGRAAALKAKGYVKTLDEPERFILNIHKRLSTLWADMLFGEQPLWTSGEEGTDSYNKLLDLTERVKLNTVGYEVALDCSIYGDGVIRVGLENGKATIDAQPPKHWFPVVAPNNIRRITAHVLADVVDFGRDKALILEIHERGRIQHRAHRLNNVGPDGTGKIGPTISLTTVLPSISAREGVGDAGLELTGIDEFLIIPVHNLRTSDEAHGRDDYSDLDTIINGMEERLDQINDILRKHAEPFLTGSGRELMQNADGTLAFDSRNKFLVRLDEKDPPYEYLTWDGRLEDALANFNLLTEQFYLVSETTPAAFGQLKQGLAESGSALKRLMMPVLAKVSRLQMHFDPALKRALTVAGELEGTDFGDVGSQWFDGIPGDIMETSQSIQLMTTSGVMSRYSAIRTYHPDWTESQIQDELDAIDDDAAATAGAGGTLPPGAIDPTNGGGDADAP